MTINIGQYSIKIGEGERVFSLQIGPIKKEDGINYCCQYGFSGLEPMRKIFGATQWQSYQLAHQQLVLEFSLIVNNNEVYEISSGSKILIEGDM